MGETILKFFPIMMILIIIVLIGYIGYRMIMRNANIKRLEEEVEQLKKEIEIIKEKMKP